MPPDALLSLNDAIRAEQVRLHGQVLPLTLAGSTAAALILAGVLGPGVDGIWLLAWGVALLLSLLLRIGVSRFQRRSTDAEVGATDWRRLHRIAFGLHGFAWGLGGALFFLQADPAQRDLVVFMLMALTAGGLINTAFDIVAAWLFAAPAAMSLVLPLLVRRSETPPVSVLVAVLLLGSVTMAMLRVHRSLVATVAGRESEARRNEATLRSAALLDRTGALALVGGWQLDLPGRTLHLSTQCWHLLDLEPADSRPSLARLLDGCRPEGRSRLEAALEQALQHGQPFGLELQMISARGREIVMRFTGHPHLEDGRVQRIDGAMQDVSQLRAIDRALADKRELLEQLLRTTEQGFWFIDNDGRTTDLNPAMCALLGRPRNEVLGHAAYEFFTGAELEVMRAQLAARRRGEKGGYEITITRPDGSRVPCLNSASPLVDASGERIGSVGIWTDLSAIRAAESRRRIYEIVTNSTADLISVVDENEVYLMVNDAWCRSVGRERAEVLGSTPMGVLPELVLPERRRAIRAAIEHQVTSVVTAPVHLTGVGLRHLESTYYPFADDGSGARRIVIITRDVTRAEHDRADLVTSAEYLRLTLNATNDAIFASDATRVDEPVRFANDQVFSLWGIRRDEAGELTPRRILDQAFALFLDPELERRRIADIVERDGPAEHHVQLRDGRIVLRRCAHTTLHGTAVRVWSFRDITAEQRALEAVRASAATQRSLLDAFPGMIAVVDGQDRYSYVNQRLAALFGRSPEDIVGRTYSELLEPSRAAGIAEAVTRARHEGRTSTSSHYPASAARPAVDVEVEHIAGPLQVDGSRAVFSFGSDVTERKRVQAALVVALEQAERANASKSMFLSSMSHELRTPMNAILGFGQLLESDTEDPLSARQRRFVLEILRGGQHLLTLINELLDLGSIEAGELKIDNQRLAPGPLIDDCINLLRPLAQARRVEIHCDAGAPLQQAWADPKRLRQVLLNLLSNAIKYNRVGGRVDVSTVERDAWLEIHVADTGPGLNSDEQLRLFRPFERLDARHGSVEGTGIGLALSRRLVEAMEGEIELDSEPGQGSVFRVRLRRPATSRDPGSQGADGRQADSTGRSDGLAGRSALYIEDNAVNVMLMEAALHGVLQLSCELEPLAGLERALSQRPDIVLLDLQLPGIDGFEVLRRLRADPRTCTIPVVAVTANAMPATAAAGQTAGFAAYLTKPLDIELLLSTLRRLLADSRAQSLS